MVGQLAVPCSLAPGPPPGTCPGVTGCAPISSPCCSFSHVPPGSTALPTPHLFDHASRKAIWGSTERFISLYYTSWSFHLGNVSREGQALTTRPGVRSGGAGVCGRQGPGVPLTRPVLGQARESGSQGRGQLHQRPPESLRHVVASLSLSLPTCKRGV